MCIIKTTSRGKQDSQKSFVLEVAVQCQDLESVSDVAPKVLSICFILKGRRVSRERRGYPVTCATIW